MHLFPPTEELQFLLKGDATLDSVMLARHQVGFGFENDCLVQCLGRFDYVSSTGETTAHDAEVPGSASINFHGLLGQTLTAVMAEPETLTLLFDDGGELRVHTDTGPYEAVHIVHPALDLLVF